MCEWAYGYRVFIEHANEYHFLCTRVVEASVHMVYDLANGIAFDLARIAACHKVGSHGRLERTRKAKFASWSKRNDHTNHNALDKRVQLQLRSCCTFMYSISLYLIKF